MKYGCIGEHLSHSFSKEIHAAIGDYPYALQEIAKEALHDFMTAHDFFAINVTIPYKRDVIPYLSHISDTAKEIGAVNTIVNRKGDLYGYNTDFEGMKALILKTGLCLKDKKVLILGTGGTSKTARCVARHLGAKEVVCVSRRQSSDAVTYKQAYALHADAQIIINTTPCGMYPNVWDTPIELSTFIQLEGLVDAIYNPLRSHLVLAAQKRSLPAQGGLYMLVAQAVFAAEKFMQKTYGTEIIEPIFQKILAQKQNVVLLGMPGCGKSTVGHLLSSAMGRTLLDTDALICEKYGKTPAQLIESLGEAAFRDMESLVVREIAPLGGCIIATGGGAVLREDNVRALQQNGRLFFLDRPLSDLLPTADRPLSSTREAIEARYRERYGIYLSCADEIINAAGDAESVAHEIMKRMNS